MSSFLHQLGIDSTFFIQFALFVALFAILSKVFFTPFLRLFEHRHQKMVADREAAEKLIAQAEDKFNEYQKRLSDARNDARREYDLALQAAKQKETEILSAARDEAKKMTQEAAQEITQQREKLRKDLEFEVESLATQVTQKMLGIKSKEF